MQTRNQNKHIVYTQPPRYWTAEDHQRFLEALAIYGHGHKQNQRIAEHLGNKTARQVQTHKQKYFLKLERNPELEPSIDWHLIQGYFPNG